MSHKRHTFICRIKIYALSAVHVNIINLIDASKQSARKQTHKKFAFNSCCNLEIFLRNKMLSKLFDIFNQNIWFNQ